MFNKVETDLNFIERENKVKSFWKENQIFEKSIEARAQGTPYVFYDGPPTANGKPHIGHVLARVFKDMVPRYRAMKGNMVPRKAGWDTHGLPVELEVEKEFGIRWQKNKLKPMAWSPLSLIVKKVFGNIRVCGKIFLI